MHCYKYLAALLAVLLLVTVFSCPGDPADEEGGATAEPALAASFTPSEAIPTKSTAIPLETMVRCVRIQRPALTDQGSR